jgi:ribose transport system ATP-binding protein
LLLQLQHITKTFPGVTALDDVSLSIEAGKVHALCGENGAGKTTLMNIVAGNLQPNKGGRIIFNNQTVSFSSFHDAKERGIAIVYQDRSLADNLSVAENVFFNNHPLTKFGLIDYARLYKKTAEVLLQLQMPEVLPTTLLKDLSPAQAQMIEIAKALVLRPKMLILDEPTASITQKEKNTLFNIIQQLKQKGIGIIYISHRLQEIFEIADVVTVLKDGKLQNTWPADEVTPDQLIASMVGRKLLELKRTDFTVQQQLLELRELSGQGFKNISFKVAKGEIVALAGLVGAGRTEIAKTIFGALPSKGGDVLLNGRPIHCKHPMQAIRKGIAYLAEERKQQSVFAEMNVIENMMAAKFAGTGFQKFIPYKTAYKIAEQYKNNLSIATPTLYKKLQQLSGGNQQKTVLARWLNTKPILLIADEPTHGVDVGAKFEIYQLLQQLAASGAGILLISSELPEVLALANRIIVIAAGTKRGELTGAEATEEKIISLMARLAD